MVLVLFAFAMVLALGTAALVAASGTVGSSYRAVEQRQAYLTAASVQRVLRDAITTQDTGLNDLADGLDESGGSAVLDVAPPDMGTAECTLTRNGGKLVSAVKATYGSVNCVLKQRFTLSGNEWNFDTYMP